MKILFLGSQDSPLIGWLKSQKEEVLCISEAIDTLVLEKYGPDFIICYGYRHILKKDILNRCINKIINLHISYLPWNKGADPNLWSFIAHTPKGVTIHYIDKGVDTGDIIAQKQINFGDNETLRTTYEKLQLEIQSLFKEKWADIKSGWCDRKKQKGKGSYHRQEDKEKLSSLLSQGWDTPVKIFEKGGASLLP